MSAPQLCRQCSIPQNRLIKCFHYQVPKGMPSNWLDWLTFSSPPNSPLPMPSLQRKDKEKKGDPSLDFFLNLYSILKLRTKTCIFYYLHKYKLILKDEYTNR